MNLRISTRFCQSIALLLLLCASLLPTGVSAQFQLDVKLTARAGFDGYCKENRWLPVRVTLENTGKDIQARVQVSYLNRWNSQTAYGLDLPLPSGARKEFFLYLFPESYTQKLTVSVTENGRTLVKRDLNVTCLGAKNLLVGLLSETPSAYASMDSLEPLDGTARIVSLRQADLPDQSQGWQPLDALVIAGADAGQLTSEQRAALGAWLAEGGKLLVTGGSNWQMSAAGLAEFLPLAPETSRRVETLTRLQSYFRADSPLMGGATLSTGALHQNAQVLVEQNGLPLLSRRAIGLGEVYYLAADPGLAPLKDWNGMETVYSHLLGAQIARPRWAGWPWEEYATGNALATLPELGLPSFLLVCGWLGFYLVVIGPANFIILRRIKRPELAWLTIPALVVAFTGFAYVSGFLYRGTQPTLNRLLVVQGWDTAPLARANAVVGIYSPNRTRYNIEAQSPFRFLPHGIDQGNLQSGGNWLALDEGNSQLLPDARLEIGGMKSVALEGSLPALEITHDLTVTVSNHTPQLEGQITNNSNLTLKDALLVTPGSMTKLGDLPPGKSYPIRLPLQVDRNNAGFYAMNFNASPGYWSALPGNDGEIETRRNALLRAAIVPQSYYSIPSIWGIYLVGWVETPLLPVSIQNVNAKGIDTSFFIHALTPAFQFKGNSWLINNALQAWESSQPEATPYSTGYGLVNQGYTLRFRPAVSLQFASVRSLTVTLNGSSMPDKTTLEMWNYDLGLWSQVEFADWGTIQIIDPERFVGPGGEVLLKLQADPNDWSEIYESSIDLVVRP